MPRNSGGAGNAGGRRLKPWRVATTLCAGFALALSGAPVASAASPAETIVCPGVEDRLPEIPAAARAEVERNLAALDNQLREANERLARSRGQGGPNFVRNAILGPLRDKRAATLERIAIAIGRVADRPTGLDALAACSLGEGSGETGDPGGGDTGNGDNDGSDNGGGDNGGDSGGEGEVGPFPEDFVDIRQVPRTQRPRVTGDGSRGVFVSNCGRNERLHQNTDNVILGPGVPNAAQHLHDHVGNVDTNAFSTNESLAAAGTTCRNRDDKSAYFWPVLRVRSADDEPGAPEVDRNNVGTPVLPQVVRIEYRGNPVSKVTEAPRFLRMFTGDARAATNGGANARPTWTCTGFTDRITDKYPICPDGSRVVRILDMPSCWDGQNIDSADHRSHLVFPGGNGACPDGTQAVPQLRMTLVYDVPNEAPEGVDVPFAVDGFATERHNPITDHAGTIGVMSEQLMAKVVRCINSGRRC